MVSNESIKETATPKPSEYPKYIIETATATTTVKQLHMSGQSRFPMHWLNVCVKSLNDSCTHVYLGTKDVQEVDLDAVGEWHEYSVDGHVIDAEELFVKTDADTATLIIEGYAV
jgi:hypothetical protein